MGWSETNVDTDLVQEGSGSFFTVNWSLSRAWGGQASFLVAECHVLKRASDDWDDNISWLSLGEDTGLSVARSEGLH